MRLTGHCAAIQYIKYYLDDFDEDIDGDIAVWIGDGYLEWDSITEGIHITISGQIYFHDGTVH